MAAVTASSNLVSRSSHANVRPTVSSESKVAPVGLRFLKQTNTHNGLRISNQVDKLLDRTSVKANAKKAQSKDVRPSGIICGMNLIFVGTEVGPWSKTGGLGDVLGGLPPALAVSLVYILALFIYKYYAG